jgi:hypothetical protein
MCNATRHAAGAEGNLHPMLRERDDLKVAALVYSLLGDFHLETRLGIVQTLEVLNATTIGSTVNMGMFYSFGGPGGSR